jgi:hypothetical protein
MSTNVTPQQALLQIQQLAQEGLAYEPPPPPIDVATWWYPQPSKAVKPTFVRQLPDSRLAIYFIKSAAGWPWDIQLVDQSGIFFRVTENDAMVNGVAIGWPPGGSPAAYRLYTQANSGSASLGFQIAPRYYDPSAGRIKVVDVVDVPTLRFSDCSTSVVNHLGPAQSWISMQTVNFGGQLGAQQSLVCEYFYTVASTSPLTFKTRERFFLTQQSGWVGWDVSALQSDGTWKVTNASMHNSFITDNALVPVFPCGVQL